MGFLDAIPPWMTDWPFLGGMIVVLLALVGVMFYMRNRNPEE